MQASELRGSVVVHCSGSMHETGFARVKLHCNAFVRYGGSKQGGQTSKSQQTCHKGTAQEQGPKGINAGRNGRGKATAGRSDNVRIGAATGAKRAGESV